MSIETKLVTADELWEMPENGGHIELILGEIVEMSPANPRHGSVALQIGFLLATFVKPRKLGALFAAETGFVVSHNPDTVLAPDVAFVCKERIPESGIPEKFFDGAPDLAVEVLSPNDSWYKVEQKSQLYLDGGTRLVWVVNPRTESVTVFRPGMQLTVMKKGEQIGGEDVLPGFGVSVAEFFTA